MLTFKNLKDDLYRFCGVTSSTARTDIKEAVRLSILNAQQEFALYGDWNFLSKYTDTIAVVLQAPYITGTVNVTQGSKTVTGVGTTFTKDMEGSFFRLTNQDSIEIRSFTSTTSFDLVMPFQAASATGATFEIYKKFYPLPLNFLRPYGMEAKLVQPGTSSETSIEYLTATNNLIRIEKGTPRFYSIDGSIKRYNYYDVGTVTIATSGGVSTWTGSGVSFPSDIVDREVRLGQEDRAYRIKTNPTGTTFTTYDVYVNPLDQTNTQGTASTYAITPRDTPQIAITPCADIVYVLYMPFVKKLEEMLLDTDISPISLAGYDRAFKACCRYELSIDGRTAIRGDTMQKTMTAKADALSEAWCNEQMAHNKEEQDEGFDSYYSRRQTGPSWI